jgi:hypothetical protein
MSEDAVAEQATILQPQSKEDMMRLLLQHIDARIDNGYARCPACGAQGRNFLGTQYDAEHRDACPFETLLEQIA